MSSATMSVTDKVVDSSGSKVKGKQQRRRLGWRRRLSCRPGSPPQINRARRRRRIAGVRPKLEGSDDEMGGHWSARWRTLPRRALRRVG